MKNILFPTLAPKKEIILILLSIILFSSNMAAQTAHSFETWITGPYHDGTDYLKIKVKGHIDYDWSSRDDELDDVYIYYKDKNGDWDRVFHGDCDGSWNWQSFSKDDNLIIYSSDYKYTLTGDDGDKHDICYVKFKYNNLPLEFNDYKYLNFKIESDWDPYADNDNLEIDGIKYRDAANPRAKHLYSHDDIEFNPIGEDLELDVLGQCVNIDRHDDELKSIKIYYKNEDGEYIYVYSGDYEYRSDVGEDVWKCWYHNDLTKISSTSLLEFDRKTSQKRGKVIFYSSQLPNMKKIEFRVRIEWYNNFDDETNTDTFDYTVSNPGTKHDYNADDIVFNPGYNKINIDIIGHSYNPGSANDELDNLKLYFTLPDEEEQLILHVDCDDNDEFNYFTDSISEQNRNLTEKDGGDVLIGNTDTGYIHGIFNYLLDNIEEDSEYALIKAEYDWDINSDQLKTGIDGNFYYKIRTGVNTNFIFDNNNEKIIIDCDLDNLKPPTNSNTKFLSFNDKIKKLRVKDINNNTIGDVILVENNRVTFNITSDDYEIDTECIYQLEFLDDQDNVIFKREHKFTPESHPLKLSVINKEGKNILSWPISDAYTDISISRMVNNGSWENINANIIKDGENSYTDNFNLESCTLYSYRVDYKIDGKDYQSNESTIVTPSQDEVQITKFDASKLEYPYKIALSWQREGEGIINYYKIKREIYGVENSLKTILISEDQNISSFIDEQTQPGLLYKYSIAGYSSCDVGIRDTFNVTVGQTITWNSTTLTINDTTYKYKNINEITFEGNPISSPYTAIGNEALVLSGVKEQESITGPETALGMRQLLGTVNGQVLFGQGNPVEGVKVVVEKPESDSKCIGMALKLTGNDSIVIPHNRTIDNNPLPIDDGYTLEAWIRLNNTGSGIDMLMSKGAWTLTFNNFTKQLGFNSIEFDAGSSFDPYIYNHYAVTVSSNGVTLTLNDSTFNEQTIPGVLINTNSIILGKGMEGNIDEIRLWDNTIDNNYIKENYHKLINSAEAGLVGYWRLDEGASNILIDMSQNSQTYEFNKNHGQHNALPVEANISSSNLGLCGITDNYGNYVINGIGFKGLGQSYIVVPMKGIHTFNPGNRPIYISGDNLNHNSKDFTDISSFPVSGVIKYSGYEYPVSDVSLLIDGNLAIGADNKTVTTDENGEFTVQVPIGTHKLSVEKQGHSFKNRYYMVQQSDGTYTNDVYFNHAIEGVSFNDTTKVTLIGRVVGGLVEANKTIGFNLSKNNIGVANITLKAINDKLDISPEEGQQNSYTFSTDSVSGEYKQYLLPEKYIISDVKPENSNNNFSFNSDTYGLLDLTNSWKVDSTAYLFDADSTVVDSVKYNALKSFIFRSKPTILVSNEKGDTTLFEKEYITSDDTISLIDENGHYAFDWPVLIQNKSYTLKLTAYEKYENNDTGAQTPNDSVPVSDGIVAITTSLASSHKEAQLKLNKNTGSVNYTFKTGEPNLSINSDDESLSFLQHINASFIINDEQYDWDGTYAYILGNKSTGTNFVTDGPTHVDFILRDPPGDASYAYIEKGSSIEHSYTHTDEDGISSETKFTAHLGGEVKIVAGIPGASSVIETSNTLDLTGGLDLAYNWTDEDEYSTVTSFNQTISTSDDPAYVGSMADIYVGHSTNILYGVSNALSIKPANKGIFTDSISTVSQNHTIGLNKIFTIGEQSSTQFIYTQNHIENYLIPNLIEIRNNFLRNNPRYISNYDENSEEYGINNSINIDSTYLNTSITDEDSAVYVDSVAYFINGDSYTFYPHTKTLQDSLTSWENNNYNKKEVDARLSKMWSLDSVRWCNDAIKEWQDILEDNERQKVESTLGEFYIATKDSSEAEKEASGDQDYTQLIDSTQTVVYENISFDAGSSIEAAVFVEQGHNRMHAKELTFSPYIGAEIGYEFNKFGSTTSEQISYINNDYEEENRNKLENITVGFVLADGDQGDYYTVDVKKDKKGNSPVFMVKGGQSSCPYQDTELTKYYKPGSVLNNATMAIEAPVIDVLGNSTITGVPTNNPAVFKIQLGNETEAGLDKWYLLLVDPQSNLNGAVVTVGGVNLSQELAVLIPANATLSKIVEVTKPANADTTGAINLILHSMCQFDPTDDVPDIADTVTIRASFEPVCSEITLLAPTNKWIVNADNGGILDVEIGNYDNQLSTFERVDFQYRPITSSQWITQYTWFKDADCATYKELEASGQLPSNYGFINTANKLNYEFDMTNLNNGKYQLQAVSRCTDGSVNYSMVADGTFDNKLPQVHGVTEPGDGILSPGDIISIKFDEPINEGAIFGDYNISLQGVLNNHPIDDAVSVQFDGETSSVVTGEGLLLNNKPFTIEFKAHFENSSTGAVISYGNKNQSLLSLIKTTGGFDILFSGQTYTVSVQANEPWNHYAIRYDGDQTLAFIQNGELVSEFTVDIVDAFQSANLLTIGKTELQPSFKGEMHNLRIWSYARTTGELYSNSDLSLSGTEYGLMSFYPLDKGYGNIFEDKAGERDATGFGTSWFITPGSKSFNFDGASVLLIDCSSIPVNKEMDLTMELWFKADNSSNGKVLFSNGTVSNQNLESDNSKIITAQFTLDGKLEIESNSLTLSSNSTVTDNAWHHLALVVNRRGNALLYIDNNFNSLVKGDEFGTVEMSKMALGARMEYVNDTETNYSDYFNGLIDEVRIWSVARPAKLIELYSHSKLAGDETGLLAYYPFEEKRDETVLNSLNNRVANADSLEMESFGTEIFSTLNAGIKVTNTISKVGFSYTVNDDEIVIVPNSDQASLIENSILEISVKEIQDMQGNKMASPVTWTAFVEQNTLSWEDTEINITRGVNEEVKFKTIIRNSGGGYENYNITNLPSWLVAEPSSGVLNPNSTDEITFTIDRGLNIGKYSEELFLSGNMAFNEKLALAVSVKGEEPEWEVTDTYGSEMNIVATLNIAGIASQDENDIVAAFASDECRGKSNVKYISETGEYMVLLTIYGDKANENITFKVFDASTGRVYSDVSPDITFADSKVEGSFSNPIDMVCGNTIQQAISLNKGWTWISFNSDMTNYSDVNDLLQNVNAVNGDRLVYDNADPAQFASYSNDEWISSIEEYKPGELYRIDIANGGTLLYEGTPIASENHELTITNGWNRIGYMPQVNMTLNEALSGYDATVDDVIKGRHGFAMYNGYSWLGNLEFMEPNHGYMLKRQGLEATTFKYPSAATLKSGINNKKGIITQNVVNSSAYEFAFSVLAQLQDVDLYPDDAILAYINNDVRGVATRGTNGFLYVTVYGESKDLSNYITFKLKRDNRIINLNGGCSFNGNGIKGTLTNPLVLTSDKLPGKVKELSLYPNPFDKTLYLQVLLSENMTLNYRIVSIAGEVIFSSSEISCYAGVNKLPIKVNSLSSGVYYIQVNIGTEVKVLKVVKN